MNTPAKHLAKETLFVAASFLCMCLIIITTSIANAGLDLDKILTIDNLSNVLINAAVTIFGTVAAIPAGVAATKQRINPDGTNGRYRQEFIAYNIIRQKIETKRLSFSQWHYHQYLNENRQKCVNYLLERGIVQAEEILKLSNSQIRSLSHPQYYVIGEEKLYFKALSPMQIQACLDVNNGKISVHKLPDFYFLYVDGKSKRSFYDQAYYESLDENTELVAKLLYKIFIGFVITCIFTGLVVTGASTDMSTKEYILKAIITIVSRIFNALTSTMWGWLVGQEHVYKLCYYINGRTQFLQLFDSDTGFKALDTQELAKAEYAQEVHQ